VLFDVQVRPHGEWTVVSVVGDVDLASTPRLRSTIAAVVRSRSPRVVLDFGGVDFLDSSGLGVLLGALRRVRAADGVLRVVVAAPHVRRVFELTGLDTIFELYGDLEAALVEPLQAAPGAAPGATSEVEAGA
jgi:anti-sigma B factor antagonist